MAARTVSQCLGMLVEDPESSNAIEGLLEAWKSGDVKRRGDEPTRLMELARNGHVERGEFATAAKILEIEAIAAEDDPDHEAELLVTRARLLHEILLDDAGAKKAYERAALLRPGDQEVTHAIEELTELHANWKDVAKRFVEQANASEDDALRISMLVRAASLVWQHKKKGRDKEIDELFGEALALDAGDVRTVCLYEVALRDREEWEKLVDVLLAASDKTPRREDKRAFALKAARIRARQLKDKAGAADAYERVRSYASGHEEAMSFLVAHYTETEDWDRLVRVYEDALRMRPRADAEQGILLQLAMMHWRMRKQPAEAEPFFARLRKYDPAHPAMLDFYREYLADAGDDTRLLQILGDAQRMSSDAGKKLRLALEVARATLENPATIERSIDAWKAVQRIDSANEEAHRALVDLYRRSGKWNALVDALKNELERLDAADAERRVDVLRELVQIYRDELHLDAMIVSTYAAILQAEPGDYEAFEALSKLYESLGRWNDLIQLLVRRVEVSTDATEKVDLLMRVGRLWIERFQNHNQATRPLEQALELEPERMDAITLLKDIYARKRAWQQLFDVLLKENELTTNDSVRLENAIELAKIAGERLHKHADAIALWLRVIELDPDAPGALDALEKLAEREKDGVTLADVIERRVARATDDAERIKLLQKLGALYAEQLDDQDKSIDAYKRILDIEPKNGRALRTLREQYLQTFDFDALDSLYASLADWEGLVESLGLAADKTQDADTKIRLSMRIAEVYENEIGEPSRAFRAYERILSVSPKHLAAAVALSNIYEEEEKWTKLRPLLVTIVETLPPDAQCSPSEAAEKAAYCVRLRDLALDPFRESSVAFEWAARAYMLLPDDPSLREGLEQVAARAETWASLADIYELRLTDASGDEALWLQRRIAQLAESKLNDGKRAAQAWRAVRAMDATDPDAASALERILRSSGDERALRDLLDEAADNESDEDKRWSMLTELAKLEEKSLGDEGAAVARYRAMRDLRPDDTETLLALERLAGKAQRWDEVAELVERRADLSKSAQERQSLLLHLADIHTQKRNNASDGIGAIERVLEEDPTQNSAISALERLKIDDEHDASRVSDLLEHAYVARALWPRLIELLRARKAKTQDAHQRRELDLRIAELQSNELGDSKAAYATLEALFLDAPSDRDLWERLENEAHRSQQYESLAAAYAMAVELGAQEGKLDADDALELNRRAARLYSDVLGQSTLAEPFHRRVLDADSLDEPSFDALKELYTNAERWKELEALYRMRVEATSDAPQKLELLMQVCFLFEELLDDVEQAIAAYEAVREIEPDAEGAVKSLERLYRRAGRTRQLADLYDAYVDSLVGLDRIERLLELAQLHEALGEPERAVDRYEAVLVEAPTNLRAQEALDKHLKSEALRGRVAQLLGPIYEAQGAWNELVRVLEIELLDASDFSSRNVLRSRIAELREVKLQDAVAAARVLIPAVIEDPADASIRNELARLALVANVDAERVAGLEKALDAADSDSVRGELYAEIAAAYEDRLSLPRRAEAALLHLVALRDVDPAAALDASRSLERLALSLQDMPKLAEALRLQVQFEADEDERQRLRERLAIHLEETLNDSDKALEVRREQLEADPSFVPALDAAARLLRATPDAQALADILERYESAADSDVLRRALMIERAQLLQSRLARPDDAVRLYEDIGSSFGHGHDALDALLQLHRDAHRWDALLDVLAAKAELYAAEGASPEARADARFEAGEVLRDKLSRSEDAIEAYAETLDLVWNHARALETLRTLATNPEFDARLSAARTAAPRFEATGNHAALLTMLDVLATSDDVEEAERALRRGAEIAELGLSDAALAFAWMERAIRHSPAASDVASLAREAERLAIVASKQPALATFFAEVADDAGDDALRTYMLAKAGEIHASHDALDDAKGALSRWVDAQPDSSDALDALAAVLVRLKDHDALADVLERRAVLEADPQSRAELAVRRGQALWQLASRDADAIGAFEASLQDADLGDAYAALEALYAKSERWSDLVALYERMIERGVGEASTAQHKLGATLLTHVADEDRAVDAFEAAIKSTGDHAQSVESLESLLTHAAVRGRAASILEPVFLSRLDWTNVVRVLEVRIEEEQDFEEKKRLLQRLAAYQEEQRDDLDSAFAVFARILAHDASDEAAVDALLRIAKTTDTWPKLVATLESRVAQGDAEPDAVLRISKLAGSLADERLNDLPRAIKSVERALETDPSDVDAFVTLEGFYKRHNAFDALANLYRAQIDRAADDATRHELLRRFVALEIDVRKQPAAAIELLRELLSFASTDKAAHEQLDKLFMSEQRLDELVEHLRARVELATSTDERIELEMRLAWLLVSHSKDVSGALDVYDHILGDVYDHAGAVAALESLLKEQTERGRIIEMLAPIYRATSQWKKLVVIFEAKVELTGDSFERAGLLDEIARLHEERGQDVSSAFASWGRALSEDPANGSIRQELERLALAHEMWNELVVALEAAFARTEDSHVKVQLLTSLAHVHDERLGDPRQSIHTYERLSDESPDDPAPLDALESLHTMVGDWAGLIRVLQRKVDRSVDATERGELLRRIGSIIAELVGDPIAAVDAYKRALDEDQTDELALEALDALYANTGDAPSLAGVLRRRMDLATDSATRAGLGLRLGGLLDQSLRIPTDAIEAFERVLDDIPGEPTAVGALMRLYEVESRWTDLLNNLQLQLQSATTTMERTSLLHRIADLYERHLDDVPASIEARRDVLAATPGHPETLDALRRLVLSETHRLEAASILEPELRSLGAYAELAALIESKCKVLQDPAEHHGELRRLAELYESTLEDAPRALDALFRALAIDTADDDAANEIERLAAAHNAWLKAYDTFSTIASSALDPTHGRELAMRAGRIAEGHLTDPARAFDAYERALELGGDALDALVDADRVAGQLERWDVVAELLERRLSLTTAPEDEIALLARRAELALRHRGDVAAALASFRDVLDRVPDQANAIETLESLANDANHGAEAMDLLEQAFRRTGAMDKVAALYEKRAELVASDAERVRLLLEAGAIVENELHDVARAAKLSRRALEIDPTQASLVDEIERLVIASGESALLVDLVENIVGHAGFDRGARRDLHLRAARWYRDVVQDPTRAQARLRSAISIDAQATEAHEALVELLRATEKKADLAPALAAWAAVESGEDAANLWLEAGHLFDAQGDVLQAVNAFEQVHAVDETNDDALEALSRLELARGNVAHAARWIAQRAESTVDPALRRDLRRQLATLRGEQLNDSAGAIEALRALLDDDPTDAQSLARLDALYEAMSQWQELAQVRERRIELESDVDRRARLRLSYATILETHLDREVDALSARDEAVGEAPDVPDAWDALESQLRRSGDLDVVSDVLTKRRSFVAKHQPADLLMVSERLSSVLEEKGDYEAAKNVWRDLVSQNVAVDHSLAEQLRLARKTEQWSEAYAVLEQLAQQAEGDVAKGLALEMADLARERSLGDDARAAAYRLAMTHAASDLAVRARVAAFYEEIGAWDVLAVHLDEGLPLLATDAERGLTLRRIASLYADKLGDASSAVPYFERAVALAPQDREALLPLCDLYVAAGRQADAIPVLQQIISSYGTRRAKELAGFHHRLGVALEGLDRRDEALVQYDAAFKIDLTNVAILRDLGRLTHAMGDLERAQKTFRALLLQKLGSDAGIGKGDVYYYLGDISARQGDVPKAIGMLERALAEDHEHAAARARLAELKGQ